MKTFLAYWIAIQLLLIGIAGTSVRNSIIDGTYDCDGHEIKSNITIILPLVFFIPDTLDVWAKDYCNK